MLFPFVPLGLPTAVAHMGKRARRWDKPITPQVWVDSCRYTDAAAPGRALLGSFPMRACWNSQGWEWCVLKSLQRGYILLGNVTWWPPGTIMREETSNWIKKVFGMFQFWATFIKVICCSWTMSYIHRYFWVNTKKVFLLTGDLKNWSKANSARGIICHHLCGYDEGRTWLDISHLF